MNPVVDLLRREVLVKPGVVIVTHCRRTTEKT
jgi:hypothetical protein